jgi:hypothetical protein
MPYIPDILYVGDPLMVDKATKYARLNNILSVTGHPILAPRGVTISIGLGENDKPVVLLNQVASAAENHSWNPAIMKIAKIVK